MGGTVAIATVLFVLSLPAVAANGYLGALGLLAKSRQPEGTVPTPGGLLPRFAFVIPAHNEASGIAQTVQSVLRVDYPRDRYEIYVVADNCSDDTGGVAAAAGARVLTRNDTSKRGKGYALEYAFGIIDGEGSFDAVVVIDADTEITVNLLRSAAASLGAGEQAAQAHYAVQNVTDSWRTRLMDVAFTLHHGVRSRARERLKLSAGLRGNGMVFALEALRRVPYRAYSLVEDVEYGVALGLQGIRVAYLGDAEVRAEMVASDAASESQRRRWEQGRRQLLKQFLPPLLKRGLLEGNWMLLDLASDMLVPPLATVAVYTAAGAAVAAGAVATGLATPVAALPWGVAVAGLTIYVARGVTLSNRGPSVLLDLAHVPKYVGWKLMLALRDRDQARNGKEWIRTTRNSELR